MENLTFRTHNEGTSEQYVLEFVVHLHHIRICICKYMWVFVCKILFIIILLWKFFPRGTISYAPLFGGGNMKITEHAESH